MVKKTTHEKVVLSEFAPPSRPGGHDGVRQPIQLDEHVFPPEDLLPDDEIAAAVREAFAADGRVPGDRIAVEVRKAIVELSGEVELEFQRTLATALADSVPSVLMVTDLLVVRKQ